MRSKRRIRAPALSGRVAVALVAGIATHGAQAERLPLWEAGIGAAAVSLPSYRGAASTERYAAPIPHVVYRGRHVRAGRGGISAGLFDSERLALDLSVNASLPVRSRNNPARAGMPDLRPTAEVGASLDATLWRSARDNAELMLVLPLRSVFTVESSPRRLGWSAAPVLALRWQDAPALRGWRLGAAAGPLWQSRGVHAYTYGVTAEQARPWRPAYAAPGGYAGAQLRVTLSRRFERSWVGAFVRIDTLGGAAFADSPLVQRERAVYAGVAATWILGQSSRPAAGDARRDRHE